MALKVPVELSSTLIAGVLAPWARTLRFTTHNTEPALTLMAGKKPVVVALWHEELFALTCFGLRYGLDLATVVSQSRDGELIARVLQKLGYATARGSSSRGGVRALVAARKLMRQGKSVTVAIDGPRGPRRQAKSGVLHLAAATGAQLVPVRAVPSRAFVFKKSWDRFQLPVPFSSLSIIAGAPRVVASDVVESKELLELAASKLTFELESLVPA